MENQSTALSATLKEVASKLEKNQQSEKDFEEFLKAADATDRLPKGSSQKLIESFLSTTIVLIAQR